MFVLPLLVAQVVTLHQAIRRYDPSAASELIAAGADPNSRDREGRTPLHIAATVGGPGKVDLMRLLMSKGADPNARDNAGSSPLDDAAWEGSYERAALLVDSGAKIDARNTATGATPLNEAAVKGHDRLVELLLAHGADPGIPDNHGFSPVENAIRRHHVGAARILVDRSGGKRQFSGLMEEAVGLNQPDTVAMLLDLGASAGVRLPSGSTALYAAALRGEGAIVSLLLARGADVNARDSESGTTALYAAASFGREEAAAILLLAGADPNLASKDGIRPLQAAESNHYRAIAESIRAAGGR